MFDQILCIGSISCDLVFQVDRMPRAHEKLRCAEVFQCCGGSAANTAHWLARLGHNVAFAGCVGDDEFGRQCVAELKRVNVNTESVQVTQKAATGIATIFTSATDKRMVTARGANGWFDPAQLRPDQPGPGGHVHLSLGDDHKAVPILRETSRRGTSTSCEFNGNQTADRVPWSNVCFMNHDELNRWMGNEDPLARWRETFSSSQTSLAVTCGQDGAVCLQADQSFAAPAVRTEITDRTGGGDAFDAGYLHAISLGHSPEKALQTGLELAAHVIRHFGATPVAISDRELIKLGGLELKTRP